jgi:primosomal replication protein N
LNRIRLQARVVERSALRFTPAGLAVAELRLGHRGTQVEAGVERQLEFEFSALAIGAVAQTLSALPLGATLDLEGFVAPARRGSRHLRIHITSYREIAGD